MYLDQFFAQFVSNQDSILNRLFRESKSPATPDVPSIQFAPVSNLNAIPEKPDPTVVFSSYSYEGLRSGDYGIFGIMISVLADSALAVYVAGRITALLDAPLDKPGVQGLNLESGPTMARGTSTNLPPGWAQFDITFQLRLRKDLRAIPWLENSVIRRIVFTPPGDTSDVDDQPPGVSFVD